MTQRDRDRLVALKKARKGLITQRQAAEEIGQSERHVRRLLDRLKGKGDSALVHALRGRRSNRKLDEKTKEKALVKARRLSRFRSDSGGGILGQQDRLVKGLRVAGAKTLEQANAYLEAEFIVWWNNTMAVVPASSDDAHRPLGKEHSLAASLSYVETRQVGNGYTIQVDRQTWEIARDGICAGLRGADVRVEVRLDGSMAVRFRQSYLAVSQCPPRPQVPTPKETAGRARKPTPLKPPRKTGHFYLAENRTFLLGVDTAVPLDQKSLATLGRRPNCGSASYLNLPITMPTADAPATTIPQ